MALLRSRALFKVCICLSIFGLFLHFLITSLFVIPSHGGCGAPCFFLIVVDTFKRMFNIPCTATSYPCNDWWYVGRDMPPCCKQHWIELLNDTVTAFSRYNLTFFLNSGTLLGSLRHGGIIPWDTDVDVSLFYVESERKTYEANFHKALDYMIELGHAVDRPKEYEDGFREGGVHWKIKEQIGLGLYHYHAKDAHPDTYLILHRDEHLVQTNIKVGDLLPTKRCLFETMLLPCPNKPVTFLTHELNVHPGNGIDVQKVPGGKTAGAPALLKPHMQQCISHFCTDDVLKSKREIVSRDVKKLQEMGFPNLIDSS